MSTKVELTASEQDLLGQMARFAALRAANGVYMNQCYSRSLGAPILILVAMGEQALALEKVIMRAAEPEMIQMPAAKDFITGNGGQ